MTPPAERKIMDSVFEGMFVRAIDLKEHPRLKARLIELGLDFDQPLRPMYPQSLWSMTLEAAAAELHPGLPLPDAMHALGERVVVGYFETFIGRALKQMVRLLGVKRTLVRMTQNFAAANNYTKTRQRELGERHYELWMNELGITQHNVAGILQAGLTVAGGKGVQVKIVGSDSEGVTYDVTWA